MKAWLHPFDQTILLTTMRQFWTSALIWTALAWSAAAQEVRDWPDPPTESDCRAYQSDVEAMYRRADEDYRACYKGGACGDAPARRGRAVALRGRVASCFYKAYLPSQAQDIKDLLKEKNKDPGIKIVLEYQEKIESYQAKLEKMNSLRDRSQNFDKLSHDQKADYVKELVGYMQENKIIKKLEKKMSSEQALTNSLSKTLTTDALEHLASMHKDALRRLTIELNRIEAQHAKLVQQQGAALGRATANFKRVAGLISDFKAALPEMRRKSQEAVARDAEELEQARANVEKGLSLVDGDANARRLQEWQRAEEERRQEEAQRQLDEWRAQQNAAAAAQAFQGFLQGLSGAISAMPSTQSAPITTYPAINSGGGGGRTRCPAISERNPFGGRC